MGEIEKIILDTDIGSDIDDAHALLFAMKHPRLDLLGVTTVYGDTLLRAKIARKVVENTQYSHIPIHRGMLSFYDPRGTWYTGYEGEGILTHEDARKSAQEMGIGTQAPEFIVETIMAHPGKVNVVAIGALTNIAGALCYEPRIVNSIKHLYIMGGALSFPEPLTIENIMWTQEAEHNILCDIQAAQEVIASKIPKTIIPLDVTCNVPIQKEKFKILNTDHAGEQGVYNMTEIWFQYRTQLFQQPIEETCMHDPLTIAALTNQSLMGYKDLPLMVADDGRFYINEMGTITRVAYDVDAMAFENYFLDILQK